MVVGRSGMGERPLRQIRPESRRNRFAGERCTSIRLLRPGHEEKRLRHGPQRFIRQGDSVIGQDEIPSRHRDGIAIAGLVVSAERQIGNGRASS
jgi:hypothetical protein